MSKDVIIIGAGLGGLLCARILSRKGLKVTVIEASDNPGGLLWPFDWDGIPCERGFHSVGGLNPGEPLEILFRKLDLMDLPWYKADLDDGFPFLRLNARTPFEIDHIVKPFLSGVWRIEGGGKTLALALAKGLVVRYGCKVSSIENQVVRCDNGQEFKGDIVISSLHPVATVDLVKDHIRPIYGNRLKRMENGPDFFLVHCLMEPRCVPWQSGAIFLEDSLMIHFGEPETNVLDLLCFGDGNPSEMIERAAVRLPGLKIVRYCTQTAPGYGIIKNSNADFIAPQTPLPWLFLTGQNLGLHGILGTTVSSFNTCKNIDL